MEKTEYRLHPFLECQPYDTRIGEKAAAVTPSKAGAQFLTMCVCARVCLCVFNRCVTCSKVYQRNPLVPKIIPKAQVAPMRRSQMREELPPAESDADLLYCLCQYTEKLNLEQLKSMELDSPYESKTPTIFTLTLHTQEVQLKVSFEDSSNKQKKRLMESEIQPKCLRSVQMENCDTGEEWRGYILTVVKVSKHK